MNIFGQVFQIQEAPGNATLPRRSEDQWKLTRMLLSHRAPPSGKCTRLPSCGRWSASERIFDPRDNSHCDSQLAKICCAE
jgi:hypothetical protein